MKRTFKTPYFEIGIKNYLYGDDVLHVAEAAEKASERFNLDVMMIVPYLELRRVAESTNRLIILAPHMDLLYPGRGIAEILPEAVKAAGADGVVLNHCEKPLTISTLRQSIERASKLDLLSFVCSDTIDESRAIAYFHPDIINPEPSELIGKAGGQISDFKYVKNSIDAIKEIDPNIVVEQAASISTGKQVYDLIHAGAEAVGACSAICTAADPAAKIFEMVGGVRAAWDDLHSKQ